MKGDRVTAEIVRLAEEIARTAHQGQRYGDRDYIDAHVYPVAEITRRLGYGDSHIAAAWLHDVVEDTPKSLSELADLGIPKAILEAVDALTEREGESHREYLQRVSRNSLALPVKFADSSANYASTALLSPDLPDIDFRAWMARYAYAISYLFPRLPPPVLNQ